MENTIYILVRSSEGGDSYMLFPDKETAETALDNAVRYCENKLPRIEASYRIVPAQLEAGRLVRTYMLSELSDDARAKAIYGILANHPLDYYFSDDVKEMEDLADELNLLFTWDEERGQRYWVCLIASSRIPDEVEELSGLRAWKWIYNNWISQYPEDDYDWSWRLHGLWERANRNIAVQDDYTVRDFIEAMQDHMTEALQSIADYQTSDEYAVELAEANDYLFDSTGEII